MKSFLIKTFSIFSLFFLLSSCNFNNGYLFNTPNSSLPALTKEESNNILLSTFTSKYSSSTLKNHLINELYKDIVTSFNGENNESENILYSPLSTFINLLIIDQATTSDFLSTYNLTKDDSSKILKEINKLRNVKNSDTSYFKFTDLISFYNIEKLNEEYLKTLNDEFYVSSFLGKDAQEAQNKVFQKIKEDLDLDINTYLPEYLYGSYVLSALRIKENYNFKGREHIFRNFDNSETKTKFAMFPESSYYVDEINNILSFKGETRNFKLTFITTLDENSNLNNLDLTKFNLDKKYSEESWTSLYFPHLDLDSQNSDTNIDEVVDSRGLTDFIVLDKAISSKETLELKELEQINKFKLNEDGFEGYSVTIGTIGPTGPIGEGPNSYYLDRPYYLIVSLKNDLPIFSMEINKV